MWREEAINMQGLRSFFYSFKQGVRGLFVNRVYSLASIGTMTACLLLLGVFFIVLANLNYMIERAESLVGITVFFDEGTTGERIDEISKTISERVEVADVKYVSAEEAWETYKRQNLSEELAETFGTDNPLKDSASLEVHISNVDRQEQLVKYIEGIPDVRKVNHSESLAESFAGIKAIIYVVSIALVVILTAVAIFLINTTVATGVQVRKTEISIMSLIGATDYFIRAPFLVEGVLIGILGAILPTVILNFIYGEVVETMHSQFDSVFEKLAFLPKESVMIIYIPLAFLFAMGLGYFSGSITARRQIRKIALH